MARIWYMFFVKKEYGICNSVLCRIGQITQSNKDAIPLMTDICDFYPWFSSLSSWRSV
jgi:hypothetical protein